MLDGYAYCRMISEGDEPPDFVYLEVNSAFTRSHRALGRGRAESQRDHPRHPRVESRTMFALNARVARTGVPERLEVYLERQKQVGFHQRVQPFAGSLRGDLREHQCDRKNLERSLEQQKNLLMTVIDSVPDLVFVKDTQGRFVLANKALAQAAGVADPPALIGKTDYEISPREVADRYVAERPRRHGVRAGPDQHGGSLHLRRGARALGPDEQGAPRRRERGP